MTEEMGSLGVHDDTPRTSLFNLEAVLILLSNLSFSDIDEEEGSSSMSETTGEDGATEEST